jgi:hypothetical protein
MRPSALLAARLWRRISRRFGLPTLRRRGHGAEIAQLRRGLRTAPALMVSETKTWPRYDRGVLADRSDAITGLPRPWAAASALWW